MDQRAKNHNTNNSNAETPRSSEHHLNWITLHNMGSDFYLSSFRSLYQATRSLTTAILPAVWAAAEAPLVAAKVDAPMFDTDAAAATGGAPSAAIGVVEVSIGSSFTASCVVEAERAKKEKAKDSKEEERIMSMKVS